VLTTPSGIKTHDDIDWLWATDALTQLLYFAVSAGLMRALPGGTAVAAAAAAAAPNKEVTGGSSSSVKDSRQQELARLFCCEITAAAHNVFNHSTLGSHAQQNSVPRVAFTGQQVIAEVVMQMLASCCIDMHRELIKQQQQQEQQQQQQEEAASQPLQRLSSRPRNKLLLLPLLLPDPQPQLVQLLSGDPLLHAATAISRSGCYESHCSQLYNWTGVLCRHLSAVRTVARSIKASSPALSSAALQLSSQLLLPACSRHSSSCCWQLTHQH
jgi:hypothetical protein